MNTREILFLGGGLLLGALVGFIGSSLTYWRVVHTLRVRVRTLREEQRRGWVTPPERKQMETMKKIVWACIINGFLWIWCSYILAAFDKQQIAESLSTAAVTEIVGAVLAYALKSLVENLSKHNHWPDKKQPEPAAEPEPEPEGDAADGGDAAG